ncbi:MAG: Cof-type HAD-IIB family hydrolase [Actinomycetota bacterium]|nr:Cof-type HAD-IIB family hydrolase [Actinomycetota bacterium]
MSAAASAKVDLVVSDLDGTLWHLDHDLHPRTREAIVELERRGVPLLIATGRRVQSTAAPLARFGLAPPAVCLNGALGVDLATHERFHRAAFSTDAATRVLAAFRGAGLRPCVYVDRADDIAVYLDPAPSTHPDHVTSFGPAAGTDDLDRVVAEEAVLCLSVLGRPVDELQRVVDAVGDAGIAHLGPDRGYGDWTLTVAGPGMSKWEGVLAYCAHAGLDPDRVLAIGDGPNDLELLSGAAVAVVTDDAHPAVRDIAHHVVGAALVGGWADLLDLV